MKQTKNYEKTLIGAIASMFIVVISLIAMIRSKDSDNVILLVVVMGLTITTSLQWVRFVKLYVAFAIEEKLKEIDKKSEN